ncbi:unnamed protein product [Ectocarpus sp. 12 AP-2014]
MMRVADGAEDGWKMEWNVDVLCWVEARHHTCAGSVPCWDCVKTDFSGLPADTGQGVRYPHVGSVHGLKKRSKHLLGLHGAREGGERRLRGGCRVSRVHVS